MNYIIKNIFFSILLVSVIELFLETNIPDFFIGVLFFALCFFISLNIGMHSFTLARLPLIFSLGWLLFFYLSPREIIGNGFIFVTGLAFFIVFYLNNYFSLLFKNLPNITEDKLHSFTGKYELIRSLIIGVLFFTVLICYMDAFIIYTVLGFPFFISLLLIFFVTFFLTSYILRVYSFSDRTELKQEYLLYAWISGLIISELSWIVAFWPFSYLTVAFIITIIYYTVMSILKERVFGKIEKKDVMIELSFTILIIILILNYTKWLPL